MTDMNTNKNTTAYMSEEDVLEMYEKIQQNRAEEQQLAENLQKLLDGDKKLASSPLIVGKTPNALAICDANGDLDLTIKKGVVDKCLRPEIRDENGRLQGKTGHGLTQEQLLQALNSIKTPAMILSGSRENSLVTVTDLKDDKDREILVAVELNKANGFCEVNNITSVYGRENFSEFLDIQMQNGKVLAENTEKANEMLRSIGKKYPKENTLISFDNSIAYSTQNVKYPEENNLEQEQSLESERPTIGKLLPFLNAKANNLNAKLEVRAEKIEIQENAIAQHEAKIDKLSARADRLEDMNKMLKLSSLPFVQKLIERNENKINKIRTKQIPRQEEKIKAHDKVILQLEKESSVIQHKLDRCIALNDAIRSFTISSNSERRQKFAQAMDNLHSSTLNCMIDKRAELRERAAYLANSYNDVTYAMDKDIIASDIRKTVNRINRLTDKINTLSGIITPVASRTDAQIDIAIVRTADKLSEHIDKGDFSMPAISEAVCVEIIVQPEQQREQDNYLKNAEMAIEDDYNSIDGIINNGPKETAPIPEQALPVPESEPAHNTEMLAQIADLMEVSVSELESKPDDIKASLIERYTANSNIDSDSLRTMLNDITNLDSSTANEIRHEEVLSEKTEDEKQHSNETVAQLIESGLKYIKGDEDSHEPKKQSFSIGRIKSSQKKLAAQSSKQQSKERKQERSHQELS